MVINGVDILGQPFRPPINTHVSYAFYLNCRKLADFFQKKASPGTDDIVAKHYVNGFRQRLPVFCCWRVPINKQLAHLTYSRDTTAREIDREACIAFYKEMKGAWRDFRSKLIDGPYEAEFESNLRARKKSYPSGELSEFRFYDLN